jgi:hypothetical protein
MNATEHFHAQWLCYWITSHPTDFLQYSSSLQYYTVEKKIGKQSTNIQEITKGSSCMTIQWQEKVCACIYFSERNILCVRFGIAQSL